jgi:hypothetical protein
MVLPLWLLPTSLHRVNPSPLYSTLHFPPTLSFPATPTLSSWSIKRQSGRWLSSSGLVKCNVIVELLGLSLEEKRVSIYHWITQLWCKKFRAKLTANLAEVSSPWAALICNSKLVAVNLSTLFFILPFWRAVFSSPVAASMATLKASVSASLAMSFTAPRKAMSAGSGDVC